MKCNWNWRYKWKGEGEKLKKWNGFESNDRIYLMIYNYQVIKSKEWRIEKDACEVPHAEYLNYLVFLLRKPCFPICGHARGFQILLFPRWNFSRSNISCPNSCRVCRSTRVLDGWRQQDLHTPQHSWPEIVQQRCRHCRQHCLPGGSLKHRETCQKNRKFLS